MVVSDLDGDGDNEVISITKDFVLQIISPEMFADASSEIYSPEVVKSVRLSRFNIQKVAMINYSFYTIPTDYIMLYIDTDISTGENTRRSFYGVHRQVRQF